MMRMFIRTARSLRKTEDSIATPDSMKACGKYRLPPCPDLEVSNCNLKFDASFAVNWNIKSLGNRLGLRRTARLPD